MNIKIKKLSEDAIIPTYATDGAGGFDFYANEDMSFIPYETRLVPTGVAMEIPKGYVLLVMPRSSIGVKTSLRMANSVGVIDSDYRGEIKAIYTNNGTPGSRAIFIKKGERVAQGIIVKADTVTFTEVDELTATDRGSNGFGSTGK